MPECYICGREEVARCSICRNPVCKVHAEGDKGRIMEDSLISNIICTSCSKKTRLKRYQIYMFVCCIIMVVGITLAIIIIGQNLWW